MEWREERVLCPYCGEELELFLDLSLPKQAYFEDCAVCCRPIWVDYQYQSEEDQLCLRVRSADD